MAAFIQEKYKLSDVPFTALNRSFIDNYDPVSYTQLLDSVLIDFHRKTIGIDADCFSVEIDKYTVESACTDIDISPFR